MTFLKFFRKGSHKMKSKNESLSELRTHLELMKLELDYTQKGIKEFQKKKKSEWTNLDLIEGKSINELKEHEKKLTKDIKITKNKIRSKSKGLLFVELTLLPVILLLVLISGLGPNLVNSINDSAASFKSGYFVENLRGDTITTWKSWRLVDTTMTVNIIAPNNIPREKIEVVANAINSMEALEIDNSITHKAPSGATLYYLGWKGALNDIATKTQTKYQLPLDFRIIKSNDGQGDIIITLSNLRDTDGYTGFTKSVVEGNEILKSFITIYDTVNLTDDQLATITRHEFGHALGLGHSTAPEDLMAPTIDMTSPYISPCNIQGLVDLYNGAEQGETICEI